MARTCGRLCRLRSVCLEGFWMPLLIGSCFITLGVILQISQQSQPQMNRAAKFGVIFCLFGTCCTVAALGWCLFDCSKKNILRRSTAAATAYFPFWISGTASTSVATQMRANPNLILTGDTLHGNSNTLQQLFARRRSSPPPSYLQAVMTSKPATTTVNARNASNESDVRQVESKRSPYGEPPSRFWQQLRAADLSTSTSLHNVAPGSAQSIARSEISQSNRHTSTSEPPDYDQAIQYDGDDFVSIDLSTDQGEIGKEHAIVDDSPSNGYTNAAFRRSSFWNAIFGCSFRAHRHRPVCLF